MISSSFAALPANLVAPRFTYAYFELESNGSKIKGTVEGMLLVCSNYVDQHMNKLPQPLNVNISDVNCTWIPDGEYGLIVSDNSLLNFTYPTKPLRKFNALKEVRLLVYLPSTNSTFISSPFNLSALEAVGYKAELTDHTIVLSEIESHKVKLKLTSLEQYHFTPFTVCNETDVLVHSLILSFTGFVFILGISYLLFRTEIKNTRKNLGLSLINSFIYSLLQFLILYLFTPLGAGCIYLHILPHALIPIIITPLISFAILQRYFNKKVNLLVYLFIVAFTSFFLSLIFLSLFLLF